MDIYFNEEGDIERSASGDIAVTDTPFRDDLQQAYIRVMTDVGDYLLYPELGASLSQLYGMPQSPETGRFGERLIEAALDREGRFVGRPFNVKAVPTGPQCQPPGSMVAVPVSRGCAPSFTPIEELQVGDRVITVKSKYGCVRRGREITAVQSHDFTGNLINVFTSSYASRYAPYHLCIAVLGHDLHEGNHIVYLMERDGDYRIGRTTWKKNGASSSHGLLYRIKKEQANRAWVLSVHESENEAALSEAWNQVHYGIPSQSFSEQSHYKMNLEEFWAKAGLNYVRAELCLSDHGLLIDYPLWERGAATRTGSWSTKVVTGAANLRGGMLVSAPLEGYTKTTTKEQGQGIPWDTWKPIEVIKEPYSGPIYSIEVDKEHNYISDMLLTHNSIRFDVSIVSGNREQIQLSVEQDLGLDGNGE